MYHGINASPTSVPNWCQLDSGQFHQQIEFLTTECRILPLREVVDRVVQRKPLPDHSVCLTFDDGFRNIFTTAFPALRQYEAPASVFLVTSVVGTRQPAWPDLLFDAVARTSHEGITFKDKFLPLVTAQERFRAVGFLGNSLKAMENKERESQFDRLRSQLGGTDVASDSPQSTLNWDEIEKLATSGLIEFGSHTHTHPILSRCNPDRQLEELRTSRDILRYRLGRADLFAYPNGRRTDFTATTKRVLKELQYTCAVTTISGTNQIGCDPFELRRINVGHDMKFNNFVLQVMGA
jgi:peptidoglycan/xylan/chitin deacetylase (PgdA/CDA1 family)